MERGNEITQKNHKQNEELKLCPLTLAYSHISFA